MSTDNSRTMFEILLQQRFNRLVITNQRFHGQMWRNIEGYDYGQSDETLLPTISKSIYIERTNKYSGEKFSPLYKVNLAYTPVDCPVCGFTSKTNRRCDEVFSCVSCGYTEAADTVGAWNIGERVARSNPSLRLITPEDSLPHLSINVGGD